MNEFDPSHELFTFDGASEYIVKQYFEETPGSLKFEMLLDLVDRITKEADTKHEDFHARFARILFQGYRNGPDFIQVFPSPYDLNRLLEVLEVAVGRRASSRFDELYAPKSIDPSRDLQAKT